MNKKKIFLLIGVFWIVILGGFIGFKEFTLRTGDEVLLKTVPVDPRDLFRGDYVILRYDISSVDSYADNINVGDTVYVLLNIDKDNIGSFGRISKEPTADEIFIKGVVKGKYGNRLTVEYGIESYFVPEGKGGEIEKNRGRIYTRVSIDKFGNAVTKGLVLDGKNVNIQ
jgi:uncharacterized membrane-anchored protein